MALRHGQHKTKHKEGTRSCFFCRKDVTSWEALSWPPITALYKYVGMTPPQALTCSECAVKDPQWLYDQFWGAIIVIELDNFNNGRPSVIKNKGIAREFARIALKSGVIDAAKKFVEGEGS